MAGGYWAAIFKTRAVDTVLQGQRKGFSKSRSDQLVLCMESVFQSISQYGIISILHNIIMHVTYGTILNFTLANIIMHVHFHILHACMYIAHKMISVSSTTHLT